MVKSFGIFIFLCMQLSYVEAKIYKCTDSRGKLYFTDTSCPEKTLLKESVKILKINKEGENVDYRVKRLQIEAEVLYMKAYKDSDMSKSQRQTIVEHAKSLERRADLLLGNRGTLSENAEEQHESKINDLTNRIADSERKLHLTEMEMTQKENELRMKENTLRKIENREHYNKVRRIFR